MSQELTNSNFVAESFHFYLLWVNRVHHLLRLYKQADIGHDQTGHLAQSMDNLRLLAVYPSKWAILANNLRLDQMAKCPDLKSSPTGEVLSQVHIPGSLLRLFDCCAEIFISASKNTAQWTFALPSQARNKAPNMDCLGLWE